jgi:hypothetical protein
LGKPRDFGLQPGDAVGERSDLQRPHPSDHRDDREGHDGRHEDHADDDYREEIRHRRRSVIPNV